MAIRIEALLEHNHNMKRISLEHNDKENALYCEGWIKALEFVIRNYNITKKESRPKTHRLRKGDE